MVSVHLLTEEQVESILTKRGCEKLDSPLEEHSAWKAPWGDGFSFFVPQVGPDKMTPEWTLREIIEAIDKNKPLCN